MHALNKPGHRHRGAVFKLRAASSGGGRRHHTQPTHPTARGERPRLRPDRRSCTQRPGGCAETQQRRDEVLPGSV